MKRKGVWDCQVIQGYGSYSMYRWFVDIFEIRFDAIRVTQEVNVRVKNRWNVTKCHVKLTMINTKTLYFTVSMWYILHVLTSNNPEPIM